MHVVLIQLSDLHIKGPDDSVLERATRVVAALRSLDLQPEACIVVVPGDVAFSGQNDEYDAAEPFFTELLRALEQEFPGVKCQVVFVPGNHDCNLESASDIRDVDSIEPRLATLDVSGATAEQCLAVQNAYFTFVERFGQSHRTTISKLSLRREFQTSASHTVAFTLINTSWLSQNPERPGHLYFPVRTLTQFDTPADIEVSVFHHPYNWLHPENIREFRAAVESRSDIILTGHQHELYQYRKEAEDGTSVYCIEGLAMFDKKAPLNGFNVIAVDMESSLWRVHTLHWDNKHFRSTRASEWRPYLRNKVLSDRGLRNTKDFLSFLTEPGTGFTHPRKRELRLHDLFVYPSLRQRSVQHSIEKTKPSQVTVRSKDVLRFVKEHDHVLVMGDDKSGKTALAKSLYLDLQREYHLVTIFLKGEDLRPRDFRDLSALTARAFREQYEGQSVEDFLQLNRESSAVLIDDFDAISLSNVGHRTVVEDLERRFGKVCLFVDTRFGVDVITGKTESPVFAKYRQYAIEEFGHLLIGKLISKWVALGRDEYDLDETYSHEVDTREKRVEALLGRQLLPRDPITILAILQTLEATKSVSTASGSFGELYEALITARLASISTKVTDLGTKYTIIARVAYFMFDHERQSITRQEFRDVYRQYHEEYGLHLDPDKSAGDLKTAGILEEVEGNFRFKYAYYYHFFTARYFRDNIQDAAEHPALQEKLKEMANAVYYEEYTHILVFYLYFTKDTTVIEVLLRNARRLYAGVQPCDLEKHVESINRLYISPPKAIALPNRDVEENREDYRTRMDELERDAPAVSKGEKIPYSDELDDAVKFNIAFKSLHILGQVVRNFPGALKRQIKAEITTECYLLGLRVLSVVLKCVDVHQDVLRAYFAEMIKDQRVSVANSQLPRSAEEAILRLVEVWAFGMVKKISQSVGLPELEETFREVLETHGELLSVQLVDVSVQLDHYIAFPEGQIETLLSRTKGNLFGRGILRDLLVYYFCLFECRDETRDKYGKLLGFERTGPRLLGEALPKDDQG